MNLKQTLIAAAIALVPMTAVAGGSLDVFYVDNETDLYTGDDEEDGNGYGFRGQAELGSGVALTGLYQNSTIESDVVGDDVDVTETRFGVSYTHAIDKMISLSGNLETVQIDFEPEDSGIGFPALDGYSVGGKLTLTPMNQLSLYAKVAYTDLGKLSGEDVDGFEYEAGGAYAIDKNFGIFAEYRMMDMEADDEDVELNTIRLGGRYTF